MYDFQVAPAGVFTNFTHKLLISRNGSYAYQRVLIYIGTNFGLANNSTANSCQLRKNAKILWTVHLGLKFFLSLLGDREREYLPYIL